MQKIITFIKCLLCTIHRARCFTVMQDNPVKQDYYFHFTEEKARKVSFVYEVKG